MSEINIESNLLSGVSTPDTKQFPLISFNCIYDIDIGIMNLIQESYLDTTVFNKDFFNKPFLHRIYDIYTRTEYNPLTVFANHNISKTDLDDYYHQFIEFKMPELIDKCVTTEMLNLLSSFEDSKEIFPTIIFYDKFQKDELEHHKILSKYPNIYFKNIPEQILKKYSQIFVKDIQELDNYCKIPGCVTYYISSFGCNFNAETQELKKDKCIETIITYGFNHCISIFDMYNMKKLLEGYKDNGK